ncbi:MAG: hypothetical protein ACFE9J_12545 [Candidatus Hermodarchaeota archaeon]
MVQILENVRIVKSSEIAEIKEALDPILYVPDIHVKGKIIEELTSYLEEKMQNPDYKIGVFIAYSGSEVKGFAIAQINPYYTSYSKKCGTFGWLHAYDFDICQQLVRQCEYFIKNNGIRKIRGCVSFPKNLGGLGIQFMGFEQQMMYSVGYTDPKSYVIEYLTQLGYKKDSEYTCVHVVQQSWEKGRRVDKNVRLGFATTEELREYADAILELASGSFYQIMPDRSGGNHLYDFFDAYSELPESFYTLKEDVRFEDFSTLPEYINAWESCDLERIQPYVPMAFDKFTGELVGIILCLPDLYQAWRGEPITRVNVDTAMVKKGYYGRGIFSALNNIGQLTCIMRGLTYFEGTSIWSNNTRAIDTIFPHCRPIRKHLVMQKRL